MTVSEAGNEATRAPGDPVLARRAAVAAIGEATARGVVARVVDEAVAAASRFGLTRERADRYAASILDTLPPAFATLRLPDGPERDAGLVRLAASVRAVSDAHHIPSIVERGLTAIALRVGREAIRRGAAGQGFTPDELDAEFSSFGDLLEDRLFRE